MKFVVTYSCTDSPGIIAAMSSCAAKQGWNILESHQHVDIAAGKFYTRMEMETGSDESHATVSWQFREALKPWWGGENLVVRNMDYQPVIAVLATRETHCLADLLYWSDMNMLGAKIGCVICNGQWFGVQILCKKYDIGAIVEMSASPTDSEYRGLATTLARYDFCVLAKFMRVLPPYVCKEVVNRCINIHHSFLPSFPGARPYDQAFESGVKLIGATAHYVTEKIDDGPIIEQEVARVDNPANADEMKKVGMRVEQSVLTRAVRWHAEMRVIPAGRKTVIFK